MEAFIGVADFQSFTRAAKHLYLSQPAISFQIKALEEELNVTLFQRNEKRITLTEAGQLLYPEAKKMLSNYNNIKSGLDALRGLKTGHLLIGASTIPGEYLLPRLIGQFRKKYPGVVVTLRIAGSGDVINWIKEREIDLGVVGKAQKTGNLFFSEWIEDELVLIAPPGHRWSGSWININDLKTEKIIMREEGSGTRNAMLKILQKHGVGVEDLNIDMELGSSRSVISAVQSGIGVGFVSLWAAADALEGGKVGKVGLQGVVMLRKFYLVRYQQEIANYAAEAFEKLLLTDNLKCGSIVRL